MAVCAVGDFGAAFLLASRSVREGWSTVTKVKINVFSFAFERAEALPPGRQGIA